MLQDLSPASFSLSVFNEHPIKVFNNCTGFDLSGFWRKLLSLMMSIRLLANSKTVSPHATDRQYIKNFLKSIVQKLPGGR